MQTNTPTIRSFAYKYGIIISIITISFSLMIHFMDLTYSASSIPQIVNYVVSAACIIIAIVIEPDFVEKLGAEVTAKQIAEKNPQLTSEQIQQAVDMQSQFFWVSYPFILIFSCLYGLVIGWVTGLFTKRNQA
jgi:hypothetical protein